MRWITHTIRSLCRILGVFPVRRFPGRCRTCGSIDPWALSYSGDWFCECCGVELDIPNG